MLSISRRSFLKSVGAGMASFAFSGCLEAKVTPSRPYNVLFIGIDDLNDWIGCLGGHPDVKTPNIDRLAKRGVLFTNAHCAAPACNPSRAALMTGIRPSTSGVYHNPQPWRKSEVLKNAVTMPQYFMANGYYVSGSGKMFHGSFPDPQSWHEYWPSLNNQSPGNPVPENKPVNGIPNTAHFDWGPVDVENPEMGDWQVTDWVCGKLKEKPDKPFFLACGIFRPHLPWYVPRKYFDMYPLDKIKLPDVNKNDLDDVPPLGKKIAGNDHAKVIKYNQWSKAVQGYLASISFTDDCVGKVMDAFDKSGYADNTIVVFWADHGWHLGEKLHWRKFALWEEATHCPMMFIVPGVTKPDQRCDRPVNLIDMYPTLIDLCGFEKKENLEGLSLVKLLEDVNSDWDKPTLTTHGKDNHSIRSERWRYIRYSDGTEELYDHQVDPLEWKNLADDPKYKVIKQDLAKYLPKVNVEESPRNNSRQRAANKKKV